MEKKFLQEQLAKASRVKVPTKKVRLKSNKMALEYDITHIREYLTLRIKELPLNEDKIKEVHDRIDYSEDIPFDEWYKKRVDYYTETEKNSKRNHEHEAEEKACMEYFLKNRGEDPSDWQIHKLPENKIIDVEAKNRRTRENIRAQVRVLDDEKACLMGRQGGGEVLCYTPESYKELILNAIHDKQKYPVESTQDVYLLLCEPISNIPDAWINGILEKLSSENFQHFKEIYVVCREKNIKIK